MNLDEHFGGKGCVVTGAASGIGQAVSELLLKAGAVVFMADRDEEMLASAMEQLGALAGKAVPATVDVTDRGQVEQVIQDCASRHGRLDFLFNNAGVPWFRPIGEATLDDWRRLIDVNLWGVIYGVHAAIPIMRKQGGGHIVNTASFAGLIAFPFQVPYNTTKYAVVGMSESLRYELADENIHVSVICPGDIATRIYGAELEGQGTYVEPPDDAIPAEEAAQTILEAVANYEGIIILPEKCKENLYLSLAKPEIWEAIMVDMTRERRKNIEDHGYYR